MYRVFWKNLFGNCGQSDIALPKADAEKLCRDLNTQFHGLVNHWVEIHEYHARVGDIPRLGEDYYLPPAAARWN